MTEKFAIGIDLGGTKLLGALVDSAGAVVLQREQPTDGGRGADAVVAAMASLAKAIEAEATRLGRGIAGIGVGAPGPVDPRTGVVYAMANMGPSFQRYPMKERLEAALPGKRVFVENDANAATAGEAWVGAAARVRDAVMLTLGTGVGGGIVAEGLLVRGSRGVGAELGHIVVEREGVRCGCGGRGCLEQYASGTAVARLAAEALAREKKGALAALGRAPLGQDVLAAARQGDALALSVLDTAGKWLGVGLVSIIHTLNPEVIVIGGGLGSAGFDLLQPIAWQELSTRTFAASREGLRMVRAALGPEAGAVGAARSAFL